jgi:hypothetical protein
MSNPDIIRVRHMLDAAQELKMILSMEDGR